MEKCWLRPTSCCVSKVISKDFARSFVIKSLVRTDIIVFADIVSNVHTKSLRTAVFVDIDHLGFQGSEPALYHNVVSPSGFAVHALPDALFLQESLVLVAGELAALVAVENFRRSMRGDSVSNRDYDGIGVQRVGQIPADDFPAVPVNNCSEKHVAVNHLDIGDIHRPRLVWAGNLTVAKQIWHDCLLEVSLGEVRFGVDRTDPHLRHAVADHFPARIKPFFPEKNSDFSAPYCRHPGVPIVDSGHDSLAEQPRCLIRLLALIVQRSTVDS